MLLCHFGCYCLYVPTRKDCRRMGGIQKGQVEDRGVLGMKPLLVLWCRWVSTKMLEKRISSQIQELQHHVQMKIQTVISGSISRRRGDALFKVSPLCVDVGRVRAERGPSKIRCYEAHQRQKTSKRRVRKL